MRFIYLFCIAFAYVILASCNTKGSFLSDYQTVFGYIIKREVCHNNVDDDDWLIDLSIGSQPQIGDSITINNIPYMNVVKLKGLRGRLRQPGFAVAIEYKVISNDPVLPQNCNHPASETYALKQILILNQFEYR